MIDPSEMLKQNTEQFLIWAMESARNVGNFAIEQSPLYVQEYLRWEFVGSVTVASFSLLGFIISACFLRKALTAPKKEYYDESNKTTIKEMQERYIVMGLFSALFMAVSFVNMSVSVHSAAKVKIAPRVVLVENILKMTRGR